MKKTYANTHTVKTQNIPTDFPTELASNSNTNYSQRHI